MYRCSICLCTLSGPVPLRQHLESDSHKRKVAVKENIQEMTKPMFCNICNKYCNTADQLLLHEKSPAHLAKVEKAKEFALSETNVLSVHGSPGIDRITKSVFEASMDKSGFGNTPVFQMTHSAVTKSEDSSQAQRGPKGEEYVMHGSRGFCYVCQIDLTSNEHSAQHIDGKNHKKRLLQTDWTMKQIVTPDPGNAMNSQMRTPASRDDNAQTQQYSHIPQATLHNAFGPKTPQVSESPTIILTAGVLKCTICDVPFSSPGNAQDHFEGRPHYKRLMKMKNEKVPVQDYRMDPDQTQILKVIPGEEQPPLVVDSRSSEFHETPMNSSIFNENSSVSDDIGLSLVAESPKKTTQKLFHSLSENLSENNDKLELWRGKLDNLSLYSNTSSILDNRLQPLYAGESKQANPDILEEREHQTPTNQFDLRSSVIPGTLSASKHGHSLSNDPYRFDGKRGFCYACDIDLTSNEHAKQHLNGAKHKKKSDMYNMPQLNSASSNSPVCSSIESSGMDEHSKIVSRPEEIKEQFYYFSGGTGFCQACNCELSSRLQAEEHLKGKPHEKNVEIMRLTKTGRTPSLYCEACNMRFTGELPANQHFSSDKHKLVAELLSCSNVVIPDIENARMIVDKMGTKWIFCDVCRKPLNTREQLLKHQQSPGHLTELEKFQKGHGKLLNETRSSHVQDQNQMYPSASANQMTPSNTSTSERTKDLNALLDSQKQYLTYVENPVTNSEKMEKQNAPMLLDHTQIPDPAAPFQSMSPHSVDKDQCHGNVLSQPSPSSVTNLPGYAQQQKQGYHNVRGVLAIENETLFCPSSIYARSHDSHGNAEFISSPRPTSNAVNSSNMNETMTAAQQSRGHNAMGSPSQARDIAGSMDVIAKPTKGTPGRGCDRIRSLNMDKSSDWEFVPDDGDNSQTIQNINVEEHVETRPTAAPADTTPDSACIVKSRMFPYCCELCKKSMNTRESYETHLKGSRHRWNATFSKAEAMDLGNIKKTVTQGIFERGFKVTEAFPRSYQMSLLTKAMAHDSVIYLPTGTGKTLVSVLTMGLMLQENFNRPVIFLVDKVLLVMQQGQYIEKELKAKTVKFIRNSLDDHHVKEERDLNLAFVCGGLAHAQGIPLWKHDVIVTTADYCINMLDNGIIRWEQFSLAVLDEVHHCVKRHPYRKLISNYHTKIIDHSQRPKILGLTASPAGKDTVEKTLDMLKELLATLGNARIAIVDGDDYNELKKCQADPKHRSFCVPLNTEEKEFQVECYRYLLKCYAKFAPMSSLLKSQESPLPYFNQLVHARESSEEIMNNIAHNLLKDPEPLSALFTQGHVYSSKFVDSLEDETTFNYLRMHLMSLFLNFSAIATGVDFKEFENLFESGETNHELETARRLGLPCENMRQRILRFKRNQKHTVPPMMNKLFEILQDTQFIDWDVNNSMALVLVRERKEAKNVSRKLQQMDFVNRRELRVTHLVGHGKGATDEGMPVKQQKRILDHHKDFNILVATSIAEEGIDICKLGLVVSMNPPSTVRALVQMRGRARKKDSHFVILCGSEEEEEKLQRLMKQEENMMEAATICVTAERK